MDSERTSHSAAVDRRQRVDASIPLRPEYADGRRAARGLAAHPQAARVRAAGGPRPARGRLDGVRDDDGRRLGPAGARGAVDPQLGDRRPPRRAARPPDRQPEPDPGHGEPDRAGHEARDHRDRGQALLHQRRRRPARHRPRALPGRPGPEGGAGRLDDRPAVRQERARRPGPPDAVREAARGRDGLPPHAQVVEAEDPAQLPQLDLLRQRRLRDRVRRAHLLRPPAHGLRDATARARAPRSSSPPRRR